MKIFVVLVALTLVFSGCATKNPKYPVVPPPLPPLPPLPAKTALKKLSVTMAPTRPNTTHLPPEGASGQHALLGWTPAGLADGYAVVYGLSSGIYPWRDDVGTNTNAIVPIPCGGLTYYFSAVAYFVEYRTNGTTTNLIAYEFDSAPAPETNMVAFPPSPNLIDGPFLLNGNWTLTVNSPPGWLQTSTTPGPFANFTTLTNGLNVLTGSYTPGNLFFRTTATQFVPAGATYTAQSAYLLTDLIVGSTYTAVFGTNESSAVMNPGPTQVSVTSGVPFVCTQNSLQFNGINPSTPVTAALYLNP